MILAPDARRPHNPGQAKAGAESPAGLVHRADDPVKETAP
jgi:hypothetical protein